MEDAALEVNYWCLENVAYQSSDIRTASPITTYQCGSGRCGEESTFTVSVLRSVGIPSRQIYSPRWSHCNDNHAWVEVWCDGQWHYMGACEPEPVFDKGWFTDSASRAILIHNKVFSSILSNEDIIGSRGKTIILNEIEKYATSKRFNVKVIDEQSKIIIGAIVEFEVLNESQFYPAASITTDEFGKVEITMGLSDIHIHVRNGNKFAECFVNTAQSNSIIIQFKQANEFNTVSEDFKITVPEGDITHRVELTETQKVQKRLKVNRVDKIRKDRVYLFYNKKEADKVIENYLYKEELKVILYKSKGNFQEIKKYLSTTLDNDNSDVRVKLLKSLSDKDYCDLKNEILIEHLQMSVPLSNKYDEDIFVKYVLCPRVSFERLTAYRKFISSYFDEKAKISFFNDPLLVWKYVLREVQSIEEQEYEELITTPQGSLKMKYASLESKKVLFTAICRTIGVPARINPMTLSPEYYNAGKFVPVEQKGECTSQLVLRSYVNIRWTYFQNWSIAILENGAYRTLDLSEEKWQNNNLTVEIPVGLYRLLISNRMPNGNLLAREYCFTTKKGKVCEQYIALPDTQIKDLLENIPITNFKLTDEQGNVYLPRELVKGVPTIIIWLDEGKEPTEHILNEFIEHHKELNNTVCQIIFVLRNKEALMNSTLQENT